MVTTTDQGDATVALKDVGTHDFNEITGSWGIQLPDSQDAFNSID
jgi:hypothetical protein